jgi:hypothetical protein
MEVNRNQFFMGGLVLLFLGIQFRMIDTFTLNDKVTRFLATRVKVIDEPVASAPSAGNSAASASGRKVVRPPQWVGFAMISLGAVLVLHAMAMQKPGGGGSGG